VCVCVAVCVRLCVCDCVCVSDVDHQIRETLELIGLYGLITTCQPSHPCCVRRLMQGLMTLADLALYRPNIRALSLKRILAATVHENPEVRRRAIQSAVVKK
jgi:hypothetical protein